jgi:site-specific recombinase XerD
METTKNKRTSIKVLQQESHLLTWIDAFLLSRKAENKNKATIEFYHDKLKKFTTWCDVQIITQIDQLTPVIIRDYLLYLVSTGHKPGGVHAHF